MGWKNCTLQRVAWLLLALMLPVGAGGCMITRRLDQLNAHLEETNEQLRLLKKLDEINAKLAGTNERLDQINARLDATNQRVAALRRPTNGSNGSRTNSTT